MPLNGMVVHTRATFSIKFGPGISLFTWLERDTVRVKCLAQEHNSMFPARARTQTARSNHVAREPIVSDYKVYLRKIDLSARIPN